MIHSRLYSSISEMPMHNFIKCITNGEYKYLKKSKGFISNAKLAQRWELIFEEYSEKSGDTTNEILLNSMKEYTVLVNKINLLDNHIELLHIGYNKALADNLSKIGYKVRDIKDRQEYLKHLKGIVTQGKTMVFKANKLKNDIDSFSENKGSESVKEHDFIEIFAMISKNQGYQMTPKNTTVLEFITVVNLNKKLSENGK